MTEKAKEINGCTQKVAGQLLKMGLKAFTGAVDWGQVIQIQGEYLRASLARTARLTQRYLELGQAVMTSVSTAQRQAR